MNSLRFAKGLILCTFNFSFALFIISCNSIQKHESLTINDSSYFEMNGLNVMVFADYYPDGHQTGVTVVQHGERVAANGDLRLEPTPGQWSPVPRKGETVLDRENNEIKVQLVYPDSSKNRKGFNPINYPDLYFTYSIRVKAEGQQFRIFVDLEKPLPEEWIGKVGFNFELFPGHLFGKYYYMDDESGMFTNQANGPMMHDKDNDVQIQPMAQGKKLLIAPDDKLYQMTIEGINANLELLDGRGLHNNGWFIVRSLVPSGATKSAIEWLVSPTVMEDWEYTPVIQTSQVGYHPNQKKVAIIELDKNVSNFKDVQLVKFNSNGSEEMIVVKKPSFWGNFLRYKYLHFDFSEVKTEGVYMVRYDDQKSNVFQIKNDIYDRHVWQPTLEYFLPVQMCHMRVNDRYKVWHGLCHDDDALMAPIDTNHFDGYIQGPSTLTKYKPLDEVPNLNVGGWHDAGDYDLRVESQAGSVYLLSLSQELFNVDFDATTIDQQKKVVEIHVPDGKQDVLQQIEHGALTIVNGYKSLGRLYRGIIEPTLRQYVHLGDGATMTDNLIYKASMKEGEKTGTHSGVFDDRWVFTEENPSRELYVSSCLAAASRALKNYNPQLSKECLEIAEKLYQSNLNNKSHAKINAAVELLKTTKNKAYEDTIVSNIDLIKSRFRNTGWMIAGAIPAITDEDFKNKFRSLVEDYKLEVDKQMNETPYGIPYKPNIWGAGWGIQSLGVQLYMLHRTYPDVISQDLPLNALNFVLGVHPGSNTSSFASGVGSKSLLVAYGTNRDEWSYIPGGVGSGTALIRPDLPELKVWPYFWQQTEYVMGGGEMNYMFLVLAAKDILKN